jgi:hypothetical protein
MRKQTADYKQIRGWVTDKNINDNVGNPTFQNFTLTPIGKLTKRKGWSVVTAYNETGKDNSNLKIDFDRLTTGSQGYPDIQTFHYRSFKDTLTDQYGVNAGFTWQYTLRNKVVNNVNGLWAKRTGKHFLGLTTSDKQITTTAQWNGKGNTKFIETPDHVYIVNDYKEGNTSRDVLKYGYDKNNLGVLYPDTCYDTSIGNNLKVKANPTITDWVVRAEKKTYTGTAQNAPKRSLPVGVYEYLFLPVYNTGSIGEPIFMDYAGKNAYDINVFQPTNAWTQTIRVDTPDTTTTGTFVGVALYGKIINNPFITHIRIYRTKNRLVAGNINKFYFLYQVAKPNNFIAEQNLAVSEIQYTNTTGPVLYLDTLLDTELSGDVLEPLGIINNAVSMRASCGCYAQNRMFLGGDRRYPSVGFVSALDKTDSFLIEYAFELFNSENEQTTIQSVGNNIYWFSKNSIYVLKPNNDVDVPYTKELISPTVGCDSLNSACVLEGICYFIFNNRLWALNEYGQYKEISAAINTQIVNNASEIVLKPNASERYVKIMFRNTSGEAVNIDYYPIHDLFAEQTGDKDIYTINGATAELSTQDDRYKLVNYEQIPDLSEEWGVDIDGNIVKRASDYQDTSVGSDKVTWLNYTADNTGAVKTYPVNGILEKPFVFNSRVRLNSVILFGSGSIDMAYKVDNGAYGSYRTYTMTRTGTECPLNGVGSIHSIKLRHTANSDVDYDFMKVKWTSQTNVDISNNVDAGA